MTKVLVSIAIECLSLPFKLVFGNGQKKANLESFLDAQLGKEILPFISAAF